MHSHTHRHTHTHTGISDVKQELDLLVPLSKSLQKTCLSLELEVNLLKTDMTDLKKMVVAIRLCSASVNKIITIA